MLLTRKIVDIGGSILFAMALLGSASARADTAPGNVIGKPSAGCSAKVGASEGRHGTIAFFGGLWPALITRLITQRRWFPP
jgi:hypothetical protein